MPDQYSFTQAGVELGGVKIQRGRDQHSPCAGNLQLDNAGGSPANQGPTAGFTEVFEGSRGASGSGDALHLISPKYGRELIVLTDTCLR